MSRTLAFALALLVPALAAAQEPPAAAGVTSADAYTQRVQDGIARLVSGDTAGAEEALRAARGMDQNRPQAVYYLATAARARGDLPAALEGFRQAVGNAAAANLPRWQARALHGVAATLERMEGQFEESYEAWQEYVRFADSHQNVAHAAMGRARVQAYNVMHEQEQAYVAVRERIAAREAANAAAD